MKNYKGYMFIFILLVMAVLDVLVELTFAPLSLIQLLIVLVIEVIFAFLLQTALLYRQRDLVKDNRLRKVEMVSLLLIFLMIYTQIIYMIRVEIHELCNNEILFWGIIIGGYLIIVLPISYIITKLIVDKLNHNKRDLL